MFCFSILYLCSISIFYKKKQSNKLYILICIIVRLADADDLNISYKQIICSSVNHINIYREYVLNANMYQLKFIYTYILYEYIELIFLYKCFINHLIIYINIIILK
jgi:hypothetical protein